MFNLNSLVVGASISLETLKGFIDNSSYQLNDKQIIGNCVQWGNSKIIENSEHLNYAPEGTTLYIREHYFGDAQVYLKDGTWYVTSIRQR